MSKFKFKYLQLVGDMEGPSKYHLSAPIKPTISDHRHTVCVHDGIQTMIRIEPSMKLHPYFAVTVQSNRKWRMDWGNSIEYDSLHCRQALIGAYIHQ